MWVKRIIDMDEMEKFFLFKVKALAGDKEAEGFIKTIDHLLAELRRIK